MVIRDWNIRDLPTYEKELLNIIPAGNKVLGGPENWYAIARSNSKLVPFAYIYSPSFSWDKIDYIVIPKYLDLSKEYPELLRFIRCCCKEVAHIGKKVSPYKLLIYPNTKFYSGYSSIIYKVNKEVASSHLIYDISN